VDAYRQVGVYTGRILKGEKQADLTGRPTHEVRADHQSRTAKALGLTVPPSVLARADEIIQ
jgi:putative ABC transport system substrate-binding protein